MSTAPSRPRSSHSRRGMSAVEAMLAFALLSCALFLLTGYLETQRNRLRQTLADRQLAALREALLVYFLNTGQFPPGQDDLAPDLAWRALSDLPQTAPLIRHWPAPAGWPAELQPVDPWGGRYRYITRQNDRSGRVLDNGNWPVFVSAGPDGRYGDKDLTAEADNRSTDEIESRWSE